MRVMKAFAQGPSMMMLNYDSRARTEAEMHADTRRMRPTYRMPEKMGSIVDGELVPFA